MGGSPLSCKRPGGFSETSYGLVCSKANALRLHNIKLYPGFFDRTLAQVQARSFSFVHLDCDAYDPYVECLEFFYPRMSPGGVILLDEYDDPAWPGCNKAADEFLAGKPEKLQPIREDNYLKYYFVKQ
jgi:O-methyltransferase